MDCVGHKTTDEILLDYQKGLFNMSTNIPFFSLAWNTNLAHEDMYVF